jgi:protein TonB
MSFPGTLTSGRRHQRLLPLSPVPTSPYVDQLSIGAGRRALAISLAVLIPALLLLLLLTFGVEEQPDYREPRVSVVSLEAAGISADAPAPADAAPQRAEEQAAPPQPAPEQPRPVEPAEPLPPKTVEPILTKPAEQPPAPATPRIAARPPSGQVYGPPSPGRSSSSGDSERVGTAPNGEPLYAAAWYREPRDDELRGYLSTASGPGWGLIACRTAPDYRVEDCVGLDEYPNGSQINRAVLAAAWAFQVRPPRLGGRPLVGAWVRIRIDYGIKRR